MRPRRALDNIQQEEGSLLKKLLMAILTFGTSFADAPSGGAEDLTIVYRKSGQGGDQTATHYYAADRVRLDQGDDGVIVDFALGRIVNIANRKRQYSETTFAEIEQAMSSISAEMEKAMAGIPEGLRHKMMGEAAKEVTLTKGAARTIAGVSCQDYTVALGEKSEMQTCLTTSISPPFHPKNFKDLVLATSPIGPGSSGFNKLVQRLREIEGFSLASSTSVSLLGKRIETVTEATEIRRGPIDGARFDLPQGFKKVDSPFARMAR